MSKVNLIFFNFDKDAPLISELARYYGSREDFDVEIISNAMEVNQFLMTSPQGILFFQVKSKQDLQEGVGILKANRKAIKKGAIKPACISTIQNRKVETILAKYGCQDILDVDTKAKTLTFKLDFWSKPIRKQIEKMEREEQLKLNRTNKASEADSKSQEKKEFEIIAPLELQSDFWLVKAKADYKRILKRYLIRLLGPSPYIGTWVELDPQPGDNQPTWKWVLKDPDNTDYIVDDGAWFFYGAKPEFDWKIKRWSFASDLPHLYFYNREGQTFSRFKMQNGVVEIAENSEFANMREEMILETCDSKFNFEGEGQEDGESKNLEGEGGDADSIDGTLAGNKDNAVHGANNLSGKGSAADSFGDEPVGGKGGTADRFGDNPLSGKGGAVDSMGNPIEGEGSAADRYGDDPLSGKGGAVDSMGNPLDGKGSAADRYGDDPLSGKSSTDAMGNPLDGKGSAADRYGDNPLSGKNSTDAMGNPLDGKGSAADRYGDDPLSGRAATDAMGNPLDGKGSAADRYGDDPLSGKSSTDAMGNPLDGKGSAADRYGDDPLSGRAATDAMGNPLDGKGSTADRYGDDPLSGRAATDAMGNPLDGKGSAADRYGDKPLSSKMSPDPVPGPLDPKTVPIDPVSKSLALEKRPEIDSALKEKLEKAESLDDLIPNLDEMTPEQVQAELDKMGLTDDLLDDLNLGQPLLDLEKAKQAMAQLSEDMQESIKNAQSLADLIPDLDDLTAEELEERKKKLGLNDDILDALNLGAPLLKEQKKKKAIEKLPPELQEAAKKAKSLSDLIPDAEKLTPEELEERKKKLGINDDILDALNLGAPVLRGEDKRPQSLDDARNFTIDNKATEQSDKETNDDLGDYFNAKKHERERQKTLAEKEKAADYLKTEKEKKLARAAQADASAGEIGDYFNEKKRRAEEVKKREQELEKEYEARDAAKKDDLNKHKVDHGASGVVGKPSAEEKERELFDALGGGLTEGASGNFDDTIGEALEFDDKKFEGEIKGARSDDEVNTESGDISVVISQKTGPDNEISLICDFEDFYEDELVVKVPKGSYAFGVETEVQTVVALTYNGKKVDVNGKGVVLEVESLNDQQETLIISLKEVEKEKYDTFMSLYEARQESIIDFMKLAKGY